ncbi:MAG: hypothetical protein KBB39_11880 [Phycicoccus sp.]|nr:hypothetical protein [Phycicoccus sp.]
MPPGADARTSRPGPGLLLSAALVALTALSLAEPNAAQPDLGPRALLPDALVPWAPSAPVVAGVMWAGYGIGAVGLAWAWHRQRGIVIPAWLPWGLALVALLGVPIGSADHVHYAAYGQIALEGGNPWAESPIAWQGGTDPVTSRVEAPWTETPSVYGPFITLVQLAVAALGADDIRAVVWWWQVVIVGSWLLVRHALITILPAQQNRVDLVWTVNPLVWSIAVLGAHVDTVATALVIAAVLVLGARVGWGRVAASGALVAAAGSTKFTYAVAGLAIAWVYGVRGVPPSSRLRVLVSLAVGFLAAAVPLHLWSNGHAYDQLARTRQSVSLATPWRLVLEALRPALGSGTTRTLILGGAAIMAVVLLAAYLRLTRPLPTVDRSPDLRITTLWLIGGLTFAYAAAAPYSLPWYDLLIWGTMPAVSGAIALWLNGIRLLVLACAYVPGRVSGLTPRVEEVTLGFRRGVAPWLELALWVAWIGAAWSRWGRLRSDEPVATERPPSLRP